MNASYDSHTINQYKRFIETQTITVVDPLLGF